MKSGLLGHVHGVDVLLYCSIVIELLKCISHVNTPTMNFSLVKQYCAVLKKSYDVAFALLKVNIESPDYIYK